MKNKRIAKLITFVIVLCIMCNLFSVVSFADDSTDKAINVKIALANQGEILIAYDDFSVSDMDNDGAITINDALIVAHTEGLDEGADAYETETTQWGLGIKKLCGVENGGSYGYYVNNNAAYSLEDTLNDGDYLYAFVYEDAENYTDRFSYFDKFYQSGSTKDEVTLVLKMNDFDEKWNPVQKPVENAVILIDGEETEYKTDSNGSVTFNIPEGLGEHLVSAKAASGIISPPVFSANTLEAKVFVTLANQGKLEVAYEEFTVTDADNDGALTINDALIVAHTEGFEGGAAAYETETTQWGLGIKKLCGVENGGSYGYYVDNESAWSLTDPITEEGCHVYAFVYKDAENYTDKFSYFDMNTVEASEDDEITLTLMKNDFDENWNPVQKPVAGAKILVDGKETEFVTDSNGKVTIKLSEGKHIVSAVTDDGIISPPVLIAEITMANANEPEDVSPSDEMSDATATGLGNRNTDVNVAIPKTGGNGFAYGISMLGLLSLASAVIVVAKKKDEE